MKKKGLSFIILCVCICGCRNEHNISNVVREQCLAQIEHSHSLLASQDVDGAMELAVAALETAERKGFQDIKAKGLCTIANIDIAVSNDEHGWEYSDAAEKLSRAKGFESTLADALLIKAKICIFADVSPESNRNDEALVYLQEALPIFEKMNNAVGQAEAWLSVSQVYVNKNRWVQDIDREIYKLAGDALEKGETFISLSGDKRLMEKAVACGVRYYRQGGDTDTAINYCKRILEACEEEDYLMKMQAYDYLTPLYASKDMIQESVESHANSINAMSNYYRSTSDKKLLEIETRYETSLKESTIKRRGAQLLSLVLLLFSCVLSLVWLYFYNRRIRHQNIDLEKANNVKDNLLAFMSKDLSNPLAAQKNAISDLSNQCRALSDEEIKSRCNSLVSNIESLDDEVAQYMTDIILARNSAASNMGLTKRETEILQMSAKGLTVKEIASQLNISARTVGNHRSHIFEKMEVKNISEMLKKATDYGMI